ncbi:phosphatase-like protein [Xylogone sp. PMI_703]|nr:phosphatase-like protein [Xylogone sp. PMI_703]
MATKAASRSTPKSAHSHSHSVPQISTHRTSARPTHTPMPTAARVPPSFEQPLPPTTTITHATTTTAPPTRSPAQGIPRSSGPNYFGFVSDPTIDNHDSEAGPTANWSPSLVSFGVADSNLAPLSANPEFESFRKQAEAKQGFNLSRGSLAPFLSTPSSSRHSSIDQRSAGRQHSSSSSLQDEGSAPSPKMDVDSDWGRDSAYGSSESKRASESSANSPSFFDMPMKSSPINVPSLPAHIQRNAMSHPSDRGRKPSLPYPKSESVPPSSNTPQPTSHTRADTLPATLEDGPVFIPPAQLKDMLDRLPESEYLLLDLRVFPQFSQYRIRGALNLCIPTTLLKRPSFNLQKLQDTFTGEAEKERFSHWQGVSHIIVYDAASTNKRDAVSAVNTLKKFTNEGWRGDCCILQGGFAAFNEKYPQFVDYASNDEQQSSKINLSLGAAGTRVAGGCVMPATKNAANPFFSNIRQNQDLIGGVGQIEIKIPDELSSEDQRLLPRWLSSIAAKEDHGKRASDKFLHLELDEQSRMTKALSCGTTYGQNDPDMIRIAGIEKGGKNRYNNIWPFEHARVKLQGRPEGACDYVNASHIKASHSNKRYIASQGPLPDTFEDFWSVIWDQDVRVIVMLTAESEGGQLKCHPYWASGDYGPFKLRALSEKKVSLDPRPHRNHSDHRDSSRRRRANTIADTAVAPNTNATPNSTPAEQPHVVVRKFTLSHSAHPFTPMREITQLHYSAWPDFGAPAKPSQLLGLVELSNVIQRSASAGGHSSRSDSPEADPNARPMLVHCSAGCGRTGTFCTVDSVIDMLKRQQKEIRSGVTPMELTSSGEGDYMSKGDDSKDDLWIFDQDLDLVEKTVQDFRRQRLSMVQSLRQFVLCYETILEWVAQQHGSLRSDRRFSSDGVFSA